MDEIHFLRLLKHTPFMDGIICICNKGGGSICVLFGTTPIFFLLFQGFRGGIFKECLTSGAYPLSLHGWAGICTQVAWIQSLCAPFHIGYIAN